MSRRYDDAQALAPVSLSLHPGTTTLVTGHNGSGKSTLLRLAAGLLRPTAGTREAHGRALYLLSGDGSRSAESGLGAVATAARLAGVGRAESTGAARAALGAVGLAELAGRQAGTLSSGQRARLTLAVALACPASVICLDEPTAHLDSDGGPLVGQVLSLLRDRGTAVLVATHDPAAGTWPADAHLHLEQGAVRTSGPAPTISEALPV